MIRTGTKRGDGSQAERLAAKWLQQQGLLLVQQNYRCRFGEIDLIMLDHEQLVFVEVRYRHDDNYGSGLDSVDRHKQAKLRCSAEYFLQQFSRFQHYDCRFDVVGLSGDMTENYRHWIKNAFA